MYKFQEEAKKMRGFIYYDINNHLYVTIPAKNRIISHDIIKEKYPYNHYKYCGEITNKHNDCLGEFIEMVLIKDKNYVFKQERI